MTPRVWPKQIKQGFSFAGKRGGEGEAGFPSEMPSLRDLRGPSSHVTWARERPGLTKEKGGLVSCSKALRAVSLDDITQGGAQILSHSQVIQSVICSFTKHPVLGTGEIPVNETETSPPKGAHIREMEEQAQKPTWEAGNKRARGAGATAFEEARGRNVSGKEGGRGALVLPGPERQGLRPGRWAYPDRHQWRSCQKSHLSVGC